MAFKIGGNGGGNSGENVQFDILIEDARFELNVEFKYVSLRLSGVDLEGNDRDANFAVHTGSALPDDEWDAWAPTDEKPKMARWEVRDDGASTMLVMKVVDEDGNVTDEDQVDSIPFWSSKLGRLIESLNVVEKKDKRALAFMSGMEDPRIASQYVGMGLHFVKVNKPYKDRVTNEKKDSWFLVADRWIEKGEAPMKSEKVSTTAKHANKFAPPPPVAAKPAVAATQMSAPTADIPTPLLVKLKVLAKKSKTAKDFESAVYDNDEFLANDTILAKVLDAGFYASLVA